MVLPGLAGRSRRASDGRRTGQYASFRRRVGRFTFCMACCDVSSEFGAGLELEKVVIALNEPFAHMSRMIRRTSVMARPFASSFEVGG